MIGPRSPVSLRARARIIWHFAAVPIPNRIITRKPQWFAGQGGRSPEGRVGGQASAALPLLDDVTHRLRRGALHLPARRSRQNAILLLREP
ncbi:MAG: hypothetical protein DMG08_23265 [Acidobacteria bacterium]|nr:MAG: hypothetical protein DMG08_23265 [Acidobacteriota bacterium]